MSHVEQLRTRSHRGKATAREPRGRGSTEAAEVRHAQTSSKPVSHTQAAEATANRFDHEEEDEAKSDEGKRRRANPEDEAQRKQKQQARLVHTHRSRASSKSTAGGAKHRSQNA